MPRLVLSAGGTALALLLAFALGYILADRSEPLSRRAIHSTRESSAPAERPTFHDSDPRDGSAGRTVTKLTADEVRVEIAETLRIPEHLALTARLAETLAQVSADNWRGILTAFAQETRRPDRPLSPEFRLALERVGAVAGATALKEMQASTHPRKEELMQALMRGWATVEPAAAWEWLPNGHPVPLVDEALAGRARTDPQQALSLATDARFEHLQSIPRIMDAAVSLSGLAGAEQLLSSLVNQPEVRDFTKSKVFEELAWREFASAETAGDPVAALEWLDPYIGQSWDRSDILHGIASLAAEADPARTMEWLSERADRFTDQQAIAFKTAASVWQKVAGENFRTWIAAHPEHRYHADMVYAAANYLLSQGRNEEFAQWRAAARNTETLAGLDRAARNQSSVDAEKR